MKISLNWIKDFVNLDGIEVDELVKRFGLSTAEVEGVEYVGKDIENVVVAEILSVMKTDARAKIMDQMEADFAANVTKKLMP